MFKKPINFEEAKKKPLREEEVRNTYLHSGIPTSIPNGQEVAPGYKGNWLLQRQRA